MKDIGNARFDGSTKLLALIGTPVRHSLSPLMHNASLSHEGINACYLAFDVAIENLPIVASALTKMGIVGYNVTMPCKSAILHHLDHASDAALLIGAVNTVVVRDGETHGYNTDGCGFWENCRSNGFDVSGKCVTVLGSGGAGRAIAVQAALDGATRVVLANRPGARLESARQLASRARGETGCDFCPCALSDEPFFRDSLRISDIVVNATSVGMGPTGDEVPVPLDWIAPHATIADVVYEPAETAFIVQGRQGGHDVIGGLGMLLHQGALAEQIWFPGMGMDVDYVRRLLSA